MVAPASCPLCAPDAPAAVLPVWENGAMRVVRVLDAPDFPAFYRVIWNAHVAEFSDLAAAERAEVMEAVVAVERALRAALAPTKINLASLGNMVPHVHWHVIARFESDSHFPQPIWGERQRTAAPEAWADVTRQLPAIDAAVRHALSA